MTLPGKMKWHNKPHKRQIKAVVHPYFSFRNIIKLRLTRISMAYITNGSVHSGNFVASSKQMEVNRFDTHKWITNNPHILHNNRSNLKNKLRSFIPYSFSAHFSKHPITLSYTYLTFKVDIHARTCLSLP